MLDSLELLAARSGTVCAVGAGGKKTTLFHLARTHPGRVGLTSTVPHAVFPGRLGAQLIIADPDEIVDQVSEAASSHRLVAFAHPPVKKARYGGLAPELIGTIRERARFDLLLVKGDGARMRWIKAPEEDEPLIPPGTTTVIPVVSAKIIGERLTEEVAHRLHLVEIVTQASYGERLTPLHIARLLADQRGALKGIGTAEVVPVINMVDNERLKAGAIAAAEAALDLTKRFDRVVLTCHLSTDPVVSVVSR